MREAFPLEQLGRIIRLPCRRCHVAELAHDVQATIALAVAVCSELLESGVFDGDTHNRSFNSAIAALLTQLQYLSNLCRDLDEGGHPGTRLTCPDDVMRTVEVRDLHDLITYARSALSRDANRAPTYRIGEDFQLTAIIASRRRGTLATIQGVAYRNDYDDDLAMLMGWQRVYLCRHLVRAFIEARIRLKPFLDPVFTSEWPPSGPATTASAEK